jgi:hypothetical protein
MHLELHLRHLETELLEGVRTAANKARALRASKKGVEWEIEAEGGVWQALSSSSTATVKETVNLGKRNCVIDVGGADFEADLTKMNAKSEGGEVRALRIAKGRDEGLTEADHYWGLAFTMRGVYLLLSEADRRLYLSMTEEERLRMGEFEYEWERLAYLHMDQADREDFCNHSSFDRMVAAQALALKGLTAAELAAFELLSDAERMAFLAMTDAERRAFLKMNAEERAAFIDMDPLARRTFLGMSGAEATAYLALSSDERRAYMHLDPSQRLAFLLMTEDQRQAFLQLSAAQRQRLLASLAGYTDSVLGRTKITPEPLDPLLSAINQAVLRKGLRIRDYFRLVDKSKDGDLDLEELLKALRKEKTMASVTKGEVRELFSFLDVDNSKAVNVKELELALRNYRRDHAYKPLGPKEHAMWVKQFEHFFGQEQHEDDDSESDDEGDEDGSSSDEEAESADEEEEDASRRASYDNTRSMLRRGSIRLDTVNTEKGTAPPAAAPAAAASSVAVAPAAAAPVAAAPVAVASLAAAPAAAAPVAAAPVAAAPVAAPVTVESAPKKKGFLDFDKIRGRDPINPAAVPAPEVKSTEVKSTADVLMPLKSTKVKSAEVKSTAEFRRTSLMFSLAVNETAEIEAEAAARNDAAGGSSSRGSINTASFSHLHATTADRAGKVVATVDHHIAAVQIQSCARRRFGFSAYKAPTLAPRLRLSRKKHKASKATQRKHKDHARKTKHRNAHKHIYGQYVDPNVMLARVFCVTEIALEQSGGAAKAKALMAGGIKSDTQANTSDGKLDAMKAQLVPLNGAIIGKGADTGAGAMAEAKSRELDWEERTGLVSKHIYTLTKKAILAIDDILGVCNRQRPAGIGMTAVGRRAVEELVLDIDIDGDMAVSEEELRAALLSLLLVEGEPAVVLMSIEGHAAAKEAEAEEEAARVAAEAEWGGDAMFAVEEGGTGDEAAAPGTDPTEDAAAMASEQPTKSSLGGEQAQEQRVDLSALMRMNEVGHALDVYRDSGTGIVVGALAAELTQALTPTFSSLRLPPKVAKALGVPCRSNNVELALHAGAAAGVCVFDANAVADSPSKMQTKEAGGSEGDDEGDDEVRTAVPSTIKRTSPSNISVSPTHVAASVPGKVVLSPPSFSRVLQQKRGAAAEQSDGVNSPPAAYVSFSQLNAVRAASANRAVEDELAAAAAAAVKSAMATAADKHGVNNSRQTVNTGAGMDRRMTNVVEYNKREGMAHKLAELAKNAKNDAVTEHKKEEARQRAARKVERMKARAVKSEAARVRQQAAEDAIVAKRSKAAMQWQSYMRVPVDVENEAAETQRHECLSMETRVARTEEKVILAKLMVQHQELQLGGPNDAETLALSNSFKQAQAQVDASSNFRVVPPRFDEKKVTGRVLTPNLAELEQTHWDQWADWQQRTEKWRGTPFEGMDQDDIQRMMRISEGGDASTSPGWARAMGRGGEYLVTPPASRQHRLAISTEHARRQESRGGADALASGLLEQFITQGSGHMRQSPPPSAPLPPSRERRTDESLMQGMDGMEEGMNGFVDAGVEEYGDGLANPLLPPRPSPPSTAATHYGLLPELRATQLLAQASAMRVPAPAPYHPQWQQTRGVGPAKYGKPNWREREMQRRATSLASLSPQPKLLPDFFFDYHKAMEKVPPKVGKCVAARQGVRIQMGKALDRYQPPDAMSKCNLDARNKHHPFYHRERRRKLEAQQLKRQLVEDEASVALDAQANGGRLTESVSAPVSNLPPLDNWQGGTGTPDLLGRSLSKKPPLLTSADEQTEASWLALAKGNPTMAMRSSVHVSHMEVVI